MAAKNHLRADTFRNEGNSLFQQRNFHKALISYNKSLCFSLPNSQQLAFAFANRSAVYLEVDLPDHCLENIQLARDHNYQNEEKLKEREKKCLELKKKLRHDPENDPEAFMKLSYPSNKKIPFIVNCLELRENDQYGRYVITNRDLNPGDVIAIEEPFLKTVSVGGRYTRCAYCLKMNMLNLTPCDCCSNAMFCNQICLTEGRKKFHSSERDFIDILYDNYDNKTFFNAFLPESYQNVPTAAKLNGILEKRILQSLAIAGSVERLREIFENSERKTIFDFDLRGQDEQSKDLIYLKIVNSMLQTSDSSVKETNESLANAYLKSIDLAPFVKSEKDRNDLERYSTRLLNIDQVNSCTIRSYHEGGENVDGFCLLSFGFLLNHSCDPNVRRLSIDDKLVSVVVNPIRKGRQLFVPYGPKYFQEQNHFKRRFMLSLVYGFECSCPACTNESFHRLGLPRYDPNFVAIRLTAVPESLKDAVKEFKKNGNYLKKYFKHHPSWETVNTQFRNFVLIDVIEKYSTIPFAERD